MKRRDSWIPSSVRTVPPTLVVLLVVIVALGSTTAVALSITNTGPTQVSMFSSETAESDFESETLNAEVRGQNTVHVESELRNTADTTSEAGVVVQLLDDDGTVIVEEEVETGTVDSGELWSERFTFTEPGLAEEFDETVVIVNQS